MSSLQVIRQFEQSKTVFFATISYEAYWKIEVVNLWNMNLYMMQ